MNQQGNGYGRDTFYKGDRAPESRQAQMVEAYSPQLTHYGHAWTQMTGERVSEMGFYFTHWQKYVAVER